MKNSEVDICKRIESKMNQIIVKIKESDWVIYPGCSDEIKRMICDKLLWIKYLMASKYCLTCGHTRNSHVFVEQQHVLKDGNKSSNYCKVKPCDCKQFRI